MKKNSKRVPVRDTGSIYSDSTVSIQNIEFIDRLTNKNRLETEFKAISPRKVELSIPTKKPEKLEKKRFCETKINSVKKICHNIPIRTSFQTDDYKTCKQKEPLSILLYRNITRKAFCLDKILGSTYKKNERNDEKESSTNKKYREDSKLTTKNISSPTDTKDAFKLLNHRIRVPCPDTDAGDLRHKFVGKCSNKDMIREMKQPYEKLKQVHFTRTENAQALTCLKNPNYKPKEISKLAEETFIKENVKLADNIDTSSDDQNPEEDKLCVNIDLDNPFNLDFHGCDFKNTYKTDEQEFENVREYRKIKRFADRIRRKINIEALIKEEDEIKKFSDQKNFDINIKYDSNSEPHEISPKKRISTSSSSISGRVGKLYRTERKPINRFIIEKEKEQRDRRYRNLLISKKERDDLLEKENKQKLEEFENMKTLNVANESFNKLFGNKETTLGKLKENSVSEQKRKKYPHTILEVKQLKHKMKKNKFIAKEKGKLREEFLHDLGSGKKIQQANISISDLSESQTTITEQSSNDDDHLKIGLKGDKYHLRGYHFRLGNEIRGKYSSIDKPTEQRINKKGCITRDEWINDLLPSSKKEIIYRRNPPEVLNVQELDDPNLSLFPPKPIVFSTIDTHPIREEVAKPFGQQYKTFVKQVIKVKKPKTLKVKKFNLTNFIFGDEKSRMNGSIDSNHFGRVHKGFGNLTEYIRSKSKLRDAMRRRKRYQRTHYLGIPKNIEKNKVKSTTLCESLTDNEDSDWIPEKCDDSLKIEFDKISTLNFANSMCTPFPKVAATDFEYMPAPDFREPTIRRDPSKPRDYTQSITEKKILSIEYTEKPFLKYPEDDILMPKRLDEPRKHYMDFLNSRHHYDHWQPTQHKDIRVVYKSKYPKPQPEEDTSKNKKQEIINKNKGFLKATPANLKTRDIDFSLPKYKYSEIVSVSKIAAQTKAVTMDDIELAKTINYSDKDEEYHSRPRPLPEYPGREEFVQLIKDLNTEIKRQEKLHGNAGAEDIKVKRTTKLFNKDNFMQELKDELKSIKSCLSSLDSSVCTNFSNDSGSYLIAVDKKVPMDYIRKSIVPFEEINRTRVQAVPISQDVIDTNPYKTVPFAGQAVEQLLKPEDKFHTFVSRIHNDVRGRLYIPTTDLATVKLGIGKCKKYYTKVANDLDEIYIDELHNKPPIKIFRRNTSSLLIKDAQRKKYICWCIQQKLVEQKSAEEKQLIYYNSVLKMKNLFSELFLSWQKSHYDELKEVECKIEPYYATTDELRKDLQELEKQITTVSMDIVYIENSLIKLTILQNFHYLLMDEAWRIKNDWLHKNENGILENFRQSIENRPFANVRKRDRDDAWAIKEFYENDFINCKFPIIKCFSDADAFYSALNNLTSKTYTCLLELHFILWLHTNLEHEYSQILIWADNCNKQRDKFIHTKGVKKTFMQNRGKLLKTETQDLFNEPLAESVASFNLRKIKAFGEVLYEKLVPWSIRQSVKEDIDTNDKFSLISESLLDLLGQVDDIPKEILHSIQMKFRKRLKYDTLMSIKAVEVENRIAMSMNTVQRLLRPLKVKTRKEILDKYGRLKLKKRRKTEDLREEPISDKIKFFYKAFREVTDVEIITNEDVIEIEKNLAGIEDESITFDFDHFLRINDYEPNYNFKTEIEITDGPEENYMKYKDLIPIVKQQVAAWEELRKINIKKHIEENPKLYSDIKT